MEKGNFEKYIAEQANQFEATPSDTVWERLKGDLVIPAAGSSVLSFWGEILIGLIITIGLVLSAYFLLKDKSAPPTESSVIAIVKADDSEASNFDSDITDTILDAQGNILSIDTIIMDPPSVHTKQTQQFEDAYASLDENSLNTTIKKEEEDTLVLYYSLDLPSKQVAEQTKPVLLYFYNNDCSHCQQLEEETLSQVAIKQFIHEHFDMIRLDVRDPENRDLIKRHKISISPSLVFINEEDEELTRIQGFQDGIKLLELFDEVVQLQNRVGTEEKNDAIPADANQTPFAEELRIFPNPSSGQFTIALNILKAEDTNLSIYNKWGQIVQELKLPMITGPWRQEFDLGNLPKGNYFIVIQQADQDLKGKLLLQ